MTLRPLAEGDEAELLRIHRTPEVMRWWDVPEELEPKYRHAAIDLFLDPALHGRGLGTEAVRRVVRHLIDDRGHHRVTIDPATANVAAIRAYEKAGFRAGRRHAALRARHRRRWLARQPPDGAAGRRGALGARHAISSLNSARKSAMEAAARALSGPSPWRRSKNSAV